MALLEMHRLGRNGVSFNDAYAQIALVQHSMIAYDEQLRAEATAKALLEGQKRASFSLIQGGMAWRKIPRPRS